MKEETKIELESLLKEIVQDLKGLALTSEKELRTSSLRNKYSRKLREITNLKN